MTLPVHHELLADEGEKAACGQHGPLLEEEVYRRPLVNMDETPLKVLELRNEKGEKK